MRRKSNLILGALLLTIGATVGLITLHGMFNGPKTESVGPEKSAEPYSTKGQSMDDGNVDEEAVESRAVSAVRNRHSYVILTREKMQRDGIRVTTPADTSEALTVAAFGKVIMPQVLAEDASMYSSAYSEYKAAVSRKRASEKEYERLRTLNSTKNVSDKTFQAALAEYEADAARVNSALQILLVAKTRLRQQWGPKISSWLANAPGIMFSRLLNAKELLIEASLPSGSEPLQNIHYGVIDLPGGNNTRARYLSPSPSVNREIQGPAYFFILAANSSPLLPGMNVNVHISAGKEMNGIFVPSSAVVWLNGGTWIYVETRGNAFKRMSILNSRPVPCGFFVTSGLKARDKIVTNGAQLLLSQEFMGARQGADD